MSVCSWAASQGLGQPPLFTSILHTHVTHQGEEPPRLSQPPQHKWTHKCVPMDVTQTKPQMDGMCISFLNAIGFSLFPVQLLRMFQATSQQPTVPMDLAESKSPSDFSSLALTPAPVLPVLVNGTPRPRATQAINLGVISVSSLIFPWDWCPIKGRPSYLS